IFAPTRCGVEPVVETIVTSAAASPRSSASATAAKTSWFTVADYTRLPMQVADRRRLGARQERFVEGLGAGGRGEVAGQRIDRHERDALRHVERLTGVAGQGALHELRPDRQRRLRAAEADRLVVVEADPHDRQQLRREADEPGVAQIVRRARL